MPIGSGGPLLFVLALMGFDECLVIDTDPSTSTKGNRSGWTLSVLREHSGNALQQMSGVLCVQCGGAYGHCRLGYFQGMETVAVLHEPSELRCWVRVLDSEP